jgi:hypothetical protein
MGAAFCSFLERRKEQMTNTTRPRRSGTPELKSLALLGSKSLADARRRASKVLSDALRCPQCQQLLGHLFDRIGSTLFLDDDPRALECAFDRSERDAFAPRVLAACIVLSGRPRIAAYL